MESVIENEVLEVSKQAVSFTVNNAEDLTKATFVLKGIKGLMDKVKDMLDPLVDAAYKAHKEATSQRNKYLDPLKSAETKLKQAILQYNQKIEDERKRKEDEVNKKLREQAEAEKKRLLKQAEESDDDWDKEEILEQAANVKTEQVIVESNFQKQEGLSIKKVWKAKVTDINLVPKEYLIIEANMSMLNQIAKANKDTLKVPGVEFFEDSIATVRA